MPSKQGPSCAVCPFASGPPRPSAGSVPRYGRAQPKSLDDDELQGCPVWAGFDLSVRTDLTALVMAVQTPGNGFDLRCRFWLPREGIMDREIREGVPWTDWATRGYLTLVDGGAIDRDVLARDVLAALAPYDVRGVAYDPYRIDEFQAALNRIGGTLPLMPFRQGTVTMSPAVDEAESLLANKLLRHGDNPVLTWSVSNATVYEDSSNNRKLVKSSRAAKIDGAVAMVMALGAAAKAEVPAGPLRLRRPGRARLLIREFFDRILGGSPIQARAQGTTDAGWWRSLGIGRTSAAGYPVSLDTAMALSTVHACVKVVSEDVSKIPLRVYRWERVEAAANRPDDRVRWRKVETP